MSNHNAFDAIDALACQLARDIDATDGAALADLGARIKSASDKLAKLDKACKARIVANDAKEVRGSIYKATIVEVVSWRLDTARVKDEMGEDWYTAHSKPSTSRSVRYGAA